MVGRRPRPASAAHVLEDMVRRETVHLEEPGALDVVRLRFEMTAQQAGLPNMPYSGPRHPPLGRASSMDAELLENLRTYLSAYPEMDLLASAESEAVRRSIAGRFGFSTEQLWWWHDLPSRAVSVEYGSADGLDIVSEMIPDALAPLCMFVTDDSRPPWICICGRKEMLIKLLREHRFFEYFVVDMEVNWILFDTHHNVVMRLDLESAS